MNTTMVIGRYQLRSLRLSLIILSAIMLGVVALSVVLALFVDETIGFMSLEVSTAICIFVCGMNSFKECFGFALQNGVTRKSLYLGTLLAGVIAAAAFALMEQMIFWLTLGAEALADNLQWESFTSLLYGLRYTGIGDVRMHFENLAFNFGLNLAMFMLGYFITSAYYRMNKLLKVVISVGVPVLLVVLLPVVDILLNGWIIAHLVDFLIGCFGLETLNPWWAVLTFVVGAVIFAALTWPLIRRAVVKE